MKKLFSSLIKSTSSSTNPNNTKPQSSQNSSTKMQEQKSVLPHEVQIDQEWISHSIDDQYMVDPNLLMCMVCYGIPLGEFAECAHCGRIFCYRDFNEVATKHNTCPNCKASPFVKKPKPHVLYASLFERIRFNCQLCNDVKVDTVGEVKAQGMKQEKNEQDHQNGQKEEELKEDIKNFKIQGKQKGNPQKCIKTYSKQELHDHINSSHQAKIMDFKLLYQFEIMFDKDSENIVFDMYQNLQLNQNMYDYQNKRAGYKEEFSYHLDSGNYLRINLRTETVMSTKIKTQGKMIKRLSKTLKKHTQYNVWQFQLDIGFKHYTQKYQDMINEQYELFMENKRLNEFIMDIENQRYRISFSKMRQINTYSNFERAIRKTTIKFA